MGWDCAFIGSLYNKMRVRRDLADELLDRFLKYLDPIDHFYRDAVDALQKAEAAADLAQKGLDEAERDLKKAQNFFNGAYAQQREAAKRAIHDLTARGVDLDKEAARLEAGVSDLDAKARAMTDTVERTIRKKVCEWLGAALEEVCKLVDEKINVVNQAKRDKLNEVVSIRRRIADIRQNLLVSVQSEIRAKTQLIAELDKQLQDVRSKLEKGTLERAVDFNRKALQLAARAFHEARKSAAEARRAYSRLKANLAVWKKDDDGAKAIAEEDHQATEKEKVASVQFQGPRHEEVFVRVPKKRAQPETKMTSKVKSSPTTASAANNRIRANNRIPKGYFRGEDGCLHRKPWAYLQGYPVKRDQCI
jgi:hypothetical protein